MSKEVGAFTGKSKIRITQITVGASRTINLGNYNSLKIDGSCTVDIDAEDRGLESLARSTAVEEVKKQLELAFKEFKPANGK